MEALLDVEEASKLLNVAVQTIYKMVSAKKLAYVKVGTRVLFTPLSISEYIKERTVAPIGR